MGSKPLAETETRALQMSNHNGPIHLTTSAYDRQWPATTSRRLRERVESVVFLNQPLETYYMFDDAAHLPVAPFLDDYLAIINNAVFAIRKELWNGRLGAETIEISEVHGSLPGP